MTISALTIINMNSVIERGRMITIDKFLKHAIEREYMSGVERDKYRVKATAEVFTPDGLVMEILDKIFQLDPESFTDPERTYLDPSCGDAQFLVWVVLYKLLEGNTALLDDEEVLQLDVTAEFEQALKTVYGVDLMPDNVEITKQRLLCGHEEFRYIVDKNIRCENALTYDFSFE
jgi:hypothetical protein